MRQADPQGAGTEPGRARRVAGVSARAARAAAASTSRAARNGAARLRRATTAEGAGESGLSRVIELNAVNAVGDTLITIALADTLFFSAATSEARGQVALYLLVTMAPFALIAPVIGPFLDRFRHGRRWAIGTSTALRAFLAWVMATSVVSDDLWLYPAAFGVLVSSRAFAIARAAAVPRVLPPSIELVTANSRLSLAGVAGAAVAAPIGIGLVQIGPDWPLYLAFIAYVGATVLAILLPSKVDSTIGEREVSLRRGVAAPGRPFRVGAAVVRGLRANAVIRGFNGFLTMFVAFLLREEPVAGLPDTVAIGLLVIAAWLGSTGGTALGATVRARNPDRIVLILLASATLVAALTAALWSLVMVLVVGFAAGFSQQLGRLSLDAMIQRDVPDQVRTSTFARSETLLQLAWVVGGFLGIALPLMPGLGFGLAAVLLLAGLILAQRAKPVHRPRTG
ncbi:MAG TPA: MFS transporter [Jiangellales bacterium]|nr:MFS transporter [Jiangellales bacterium]